MRLLCRIMASMFEGAVSMKAVTYQGIRDVQVKEVNDPKLEKSDDILVQITSTAICGSDLHLIHGMIPNLPKNYIIGHEPIGIVLETGPDVSKLKKGDRVIIPFTVACGQCFYCQNQLESQCDQSNPNRNGSIILVQQSKQRDLFNNEHGES